ncbi:MAG: MFS transporter [Magnetospiraceae bacterium]
MKPVISRDMFGPFVLLALLALAMPLSLQTWMALINNYAIDKAGFDGADIGILQSVREIPGFLSFAVVFFLPFIREQRLVVLCLILLGIGTALSGFYTDLVGLAMITLIASIGFHYSEALQQSLALQWFSKAEAPKKLGKLVAVRSSGSLIAFAFVFLADDFLDLEIRWIFVAGGAATVLLALVAWIFFPLFQSGTEQHKTLILRKRYWLYYALTFMAGARRQIFTVFAGFLMVEKFGFEPGSVALIFLANGVLTMIVAPLVGRMIAHWGERRALILEYSGLILVFTAYAFVETAWFAVFLYMLDHLFFAMALAIKTYFQKIADPADIAASTSVSFTINHIVAVVIPVLFGMVWLVSPAYVFLAGAGIAAISLLLSFLVPRHPEPGLEVSVESLRVKPAPAE